MKSLLKLTGSVDFITISSPVGTGRKGIEARGKKNEQAQAFLSVSLLLYFGSRRKRLFGGNRSGLATPFLLFP
jgi:hypothetical protein